MEHREVEAGELAVGGGADIVRGGMTRLKGGLEAKETRRIGTGRTTNCGRRAGENSVGKSDGAGSERVRRWRRTRRKRRGGSGGEHAQENDRWLRLPGSELSGQAGRETPGTRLDVLRPSWPAPHSTKRGSPTHRRCLQHDTHRPTPPTNGHNAH